MPATRRFAFLSTLALLSTSILVPSLSAQGLLIDSRPGHRVPLPRLRPEPTPTPGEYQIKSLELNVQLRKQIASVQLAQRFRNPGSQTLEVAFVAPLPADAVIDEMTLLVNGKEFAAKIMPADEAREFYQSIVRKNEDPALLEWQGHGLVKTSVFPVPPGEERTVLLRYQQVCRKANGTVNFLAPLAAAKYTSEPLEKLKINVAIETGATIGNLYSPNYKANIKRNDANHAVVSYEGKEIIPSSDFRLLYDVTQDGVAASVVSYRPNPNEPGYFLVLASPELPKNNTPPPAKTVLFVVDRSGSMNGKKMEQAKAALRYVLNNLREGDNFNIVAYDDDVETFRPELARYDEETRKSALGFVEGLFAGGSTNINEAMQQALAMATDEERPTYLLFLTDGNATAGETREAAIAKNVSDANKNRVRVFPFGVGFDVNSRLLDTISGRNFGVTEYVKPDEDIESAVSQLYRRIGTPVLTDVELALAKTDESSTAIPLNRIYPAGAFDLFAGDQAVIVGRYAQSGDAILKLSGKLADETKSFAFPTKLASSSTADGNVFVAKLWATRRVAEIIDKIDLEGKNDELVNELVSLATEHGILTQYTSFLADEDADHNEVASNRTRAALSTVDLEEEKGQYGFFQRSAKQKLGRARSAPAAANDAIVDSLAASSAPALRRVRQQLATGNAAYYDSRTNSQKVSNNVRQVGRKTFFLRDGRWVDSAVNAEQEKQAIKVKRYSDDYFKLADTYGEHTNQYLAIEEPVIVMLGDKVFAW